MTCAERVRAELEVLGLDASAPRPRLLRAHARRARRDARRRHLLASAAAASTHRRGQGGDPDPADPQGSPGRLPHPRRRDRPGRRDVLRGRAGPLRRDRLPLLAAPGPGGPAPDRSAGGLPPRHRCVGAPRLWDAWTPGGLEAVLAALDSAPGGTGATEGAVSGAAASRSSRRCSPGRPVADLGGRHQPAVRPGGGGGRQAGPPGRRPRRGRGSAGRRHGGRPGGGSWSTPRGYRQSPYADMGPAGVDTRDTRRMTGERRAVPDPSARRGRPPATRRASSGMPARGARGTRVSGDLAPTGPARTRVAPLPTGPARGRRPATCPTRRGRHLRAHLRGVGLPPRPGRPSLGELGRPLESSTSAAAPGASRSRRRARPPRHRRRPQPRRAGRAAAPRRRRRRRRPGARRPGRRRRPCSTLSRPLPPPTWCSATASWSMSTTRPRRCATWPRCCAAAARPACSSPHGSPPCWPARWPAASPRPARPRPATADGDRATRCPAGSPRPASPRWSQAAGLPCRPVHGVRLFSDLVPGTLVDGEPAAAPAGPGAAAARHPARLPRPLATHCTSSLPALSTVR